jgi:galactose-1-phosphate uridylyltransferase
MITGLALTPVLEFVAALPAYKAGHPADLPVKGGVPMTKEEFYLLEFTGSE